MLVLLTMQEVAIVVLCEVRSGRPRVPPAGVERSQEVAGRAQDAPRLHDS